MVEVEVSRIDVTSGFNFVLMLGRDSQSRISLLSSP